MNPMKKRRKEKNGKDSCQSKAANLLKTKPNIKHFFWNHLLPQVCLGGYGYWSLPSIIRSSALYHWYVNPWPIIKIYHWLSEMNHCLIIDSSFIDSGPMVKYLLGYLWLAVAASVINCCVVFDKSLMNHYVDIDHWLISLAIDYHGLSLID